MFARVASFEGGDEERLAALNREAVAAGTIDLPEGIAGAMVLGSNADGKRLFITMFDSRESMEAAEERFESMGDEIPENVRGRRRSVDHFEVIWQQDL